MHKKTVRVLIVDDNADFRSLLERALKSRPVEIKLHERAEGAIDFLRSSDQMPTLAFVDLRLSGSSGEDFIRQVRAEESLKSLEVILTSGVDDVGPIAHRCGADGHLRKPFELAKFYEIVDRTINRVHASRRDAPDEAKKGRT